MAPERSYHSHRFTPVATGFAVFTAIHTGPRARPGSLAMLESTRRSSHVACFRAPDALHAHPEHEILLGEHGRAGYQLVDGTIMPLCAGQALVMPSGLAHTLVVDEQIAMLGIIVHPDLFRPLLRTHPHDPLLAQLTQPGAGLSARVVTDQRYLTILRELFEQCCAEQGTADGLQGPSLTLIGQYVAINVLRMMRLPDSGPSPDSTAQRVSQVRAWMDRHFLDAVDVSTLATRAQLSRSQFCAVFQRLFGISAKAYIIQRRLHQAAMLLSHTSQPILRIAMCTGFTTLSTFNRDFKNHFGMSPSDYRKKRTVDQPKPEAEDAVFLDD